MSNRKRGQTYRQAKPLMPIFLAGDASNAVKAEAKLILAQLAPYPSVDAKAISACDPDLIRRAAALTGAGLDFFRALRGERVVHSEHLRSHVGAHLRYVRDREGRLPTSHDLPQDHSAIAMSWLYWGSVEKWAEGSSDREQKPKGYWGNEANQLMHLRRLAASHPGRPLTHSLLNEVGLHRFAQQVNAAQLDDLARKVGVDRNLSYHDARYWNRERLIHEYARVCSPYGMALSQYALAKVGGSASSLRNNARRSFPSFRAMQEAAAKVHPWLRLEPRPTNSDGQLMDSWSEVAVYQAIRQALPTASIAMHVVLPGGEHRSCDLVVGGTAYVEVTQYSLMDLQDGAGSKRQRKYQRQWAMKSLTYKAMGVTPIVVEPDDIYCATRLGLKVAEIAASLGMAAPLVAPSGSFTQIRAKGDWNFERLVERVGGVARSIGRFPTAQELTQAGRSHATNMLKRRGVRQRVAAAIGYPALQEAWTKQRVVEEIADHVRKVGRYPTMAALQAIGKGKLVGAANRLFAGKPSGLRDEVARVCGMALTPARAPMGSYSTEEALAGLLRPLATALRRMPSGREMLDAGLPTTVPATVSRRVGFPPYGGHPGGAIRGPPAPDRCRGAHHLAGGHRKGSAAGVQEDRDHDPGEGEPWSERNPPHTPSGRRRRGAPGSCSRDGQGAPGPVCSAPRGGVSRVQAGRTRRRQRAATPGAPDRGAGRRPGTRQAPGHGQRLGAGRPGLAALGGLQPVHGHGAC